MPPKVRSAIGMLHIARSENYNCHHWRALGLLSLCEKVVLVLNDRYYFRDGLKALALVVSGLVIGS
jgi:hypothetical protein